MDKKKYYSPTYDEIRKFEYLLKLVEDIPDVNIHLHNYLFCKALEKFIIEYPNSLEDSIASIKEIRVGFLKLFPEFIDTNSDISNDKKVLKYILEKEYTNHKCALDYLDKFSFNIKKESYYLKKILNLLLDKLNKDPKYRFSDTCLNDDLLVSILNGDIFNIFYMQEEDYHISGYDIRKNLISIDPIYAINMFKPHYDNYPLNPEFICKNADIPTLEKANLLLESVISLEKRYDAKEYGFDYRYNSILNNNESKVKTLIKYIIR